MPPDDLLARAARALASADALLIGAGAGMGVDSGLPDFRGDEGFWKAYPPYRKLGLSFAELADPQWFRRDPTLAGGFYGHRLALYRRTVPHEGFARLRGWASRMAHGAFVFTSNVDGQFQRAGFDPARIVECHGAIDFAQCTAGCGVGIFAAGFDVALDEQTLRARAPLPACPGCGALARPNILMFGDVEWDARRTQAQRVRLSRWLGGLAGARVAVVECGAGTAIPTVRAFCEDAAARFNGSLVRLNLRDPAVPSGQIGISIGARDGLVALDRLLFA